MRVERRVLVAVVAVSLAVLACSLGGAAGELQEVQEGVEAVQEMAEAVEGQESAPGAGSPLGDECPVVSSAEIEAATGLSVVGATTVNAPQALHCSFALEGETFFQLQVTGGGSEEEVGDAYQSLVNNAVGDGSAVDGPWEAGMFFPSSGLMFRTASNVVWINLQDQNAALQVGSAVAGGLPYTPGG